MGRSSFDPDREKRTTSLARRHVVTSFVDKERAAGVTRRPLGTTTRLSRDYLPPVLMTVPDVQGSTRPVIGSNSPRIWQIEPPATRPKTSKPGTVIARYATKEKGTLVVTAGVIWWN